VWERVEVLTVFWWRNLRERDHVEDSDIDGSIILRWILKNLTGLIWLRIGTGGGLL